MPDGLSLSVEVLPEQAGEDLLKGLSGDSFVFVSKERAIRADGVAARIEVPPGTDRFSRAAARVEEVLSSFGKGSGGRKGAAIAVGALPFSDSVPGELIVPARTIVNENDGTSLVMTIGSHHVASARAKPRPAEHRAVSYLLENACSFSQWEQSIEAARAAIAAGEIGKVVLARSALVRSDVEFDLETVLRRLQASSVDSYVFAVGGFLGASPELLVARRGQCVVSRPMAGTIERSDAGTGATSPAEQRALRESKKDNEEHRIVVEDVREALAPFCTSLSVDGPHIRGFASVAHLVSVVEGELEKNAPSALGLLDGLHPTAAVGGRPRARALELIAELEPTERGLYAGPVGWVDANGDGEFAIALRCAAINANTARLYAGAGILAASTAEGEWEETGAKFEPALRALVRL